VSDSQQQVATDEQPPASTKHQLSINPRRLLHKCEAAAALLLASAPSVDDPFGLAKVLPVWFRWRAHPVGALVAAAARHPRRTALIDDEGGITFEALDQETNALARAWRRAGHGSGTTFGILCEPSRTFLTASMAAQKLGADVVYLNAAFSAPQVAEVVQSERVDALVYDSQLADAATEATGCVMISEQDMMTSVTGVPTGPLRPPKEGPGRTVVLTSGTTGRPKGAQRRANGGPLDAAGLLACLPVQAGDRIVVAAPLFHGLGLMGATLGLSLSSTVVVRRRFDPEQTLQDIATNRATVLIAVPVMLQRILALPERKRSSYALSDLRIVLCGGSALPAEVALRFMDEFGDVLYNFYGSTEAGWATCASPRDLRAAPGTAGRATPGVSVRIVGPAGERVPTGTTGRVLVGSRLRMDGYTGGGGKEVIDGLVATGDLGHVDQSGRLFIEGREDEMIVSGGENVFPAEVEEILLAHEGVEEVAVIGVEDAEFGQRLKAFVVRTAGAAVTEDDIKRYVHDRLARFKTPREVVFVDVLPRTPTGKVLKRELAKL
jgi:acyl-CoA synthetase (AMP-forming)/AMP-acid ligase II